MMYLPFVVMLIILGLLVFVVQRRKEDGKRTFLQGHRVKWLIIGYSLILLLSVGAYYFIPSPKVIHSDQVQLDEWFDMYPYASGLADISELQPYIKDTQSFAYSEDELKLELYGALYAEPFFVRVEKSETLIDQIEVNYYETPAAVQGIDISDDIPSVDISMADDALNLYLPEQVDVHMTLYKNEFPFNQFLPGRSLDFTMNVIFPERLILLKVPTHVDVIGDDMFDIYESE